MNAKSVLLAGVIVVSGIGSMARADTLESVQKRLDTASASITSLTATQRSDTQLDMGTIKVEAKFEMMIKDGHTLSRVESKMESNIVSAGQKMRSSITSISVCDGRFAWSMTDQSGIKAVTKMKDPNQSGTLAGTSFFRDLGTQHSLKLLPDETVEGKSVFVIEATPKNGSRSKKLFYIVKDTAIIPKIVTYDDKGNIQTKTTMTDIKINPSIPASHFTFTPPKGVPVTDYASKQN